MTATTFTGSVSTAQSWTRARRAAAVAIAVVCLLVAAFVLGRATAHSTHPTTSPAAAQLAPAGSHANLASCVVGKPC